MPNTIITIRSSVCIHPPLITSNVHPEINHYNHEKEREKTMLNYAQHFGYILLQFLNFILIPLWLAFTIVTLFKLKQRPLPLLAKTIWAFMIILVPILGAVAFYIIKPTADAE